MTAGDSIVFFVVFIIGAAFTQVFIASRLVQKIHPTSVDDGLLHRLRYGAWNKVCMALYVAAFIALVMLLQHYR